MYSFDARVRYSECDEKGRLGLVPMMNYLQDCSTFHCEEHGGGIRALGEQGFGWILAAWSIEIDRLPEFGEKIEVSTWCYEMKSLHALRNFRIQDEGGRPIVRADSQWLLYSLSENKVVRIPESQRFYLEDTPRLDMPPMQRKIRPEGEGTEASPVLVSEQQLDTNRHVNNAQYVLMAVDALSELGLGGNPARLAVQYRGMARLGDTVVPVVHARKDGAVVELKGADGSVYATVKIQGE